MARLYKNDNNIITVVSGNMYVEGAEEFDLRGLSDKTIERIKAKPQEAAKYATQKRKTAERLKIKARERVAEVKKKRGGRIWLSTSGR